MRRITLIFAALCTFVAVSQAAAADDCVVKVGRIVPITGPLLDLGRETPWVDEHKVKPINDAGGLQVGDKKCRIDFKVYDSKGTAAGSGEAATQAILGDKVDVVMPMGTPDTTNAPSDLCERYKVPCIASGTPVEAWLFGPDGKPKTYEYSYLFFFSVPDLVKNHIGMIKALPGGFNGAIGYLYPNDQDGIIFASLFDPAFKKEGWNPVDPGRFAQGLPDFSAIINQFKRAHVEVVTGVLAPPDLQSYMQQASQLGFKPKMYVIDKGTGYPEPMRALGDYGIDILSVNFWSPAFPGKSKYGGYDGQGLVDAYQTANPGKLYAPTLALGDTSYDILFDALQRAGSTDKGALLKAIGSTDLDTVYGRIRFNAQHYAVTPLGGAQWRRVNNTLVKENVFNSVYPEVKITAPMRLYQQ